MKKEMHLVMVATGSYDDYNESPIFVTEDKEKALLWVEKYNKLIGQLKTLFYFLSGGKYCFAKTK